MNRFWSKVNKTDNCWNWLACKTKDGYGRIFIKDKVLLAHRVSWAIHDGQIPKGLQVLHRCDNPSCVNPAHLFLGTVSDNMRDSVAKGRNSNSKKTHCSLGHEYSKENTTVSKGERSCRTCRREQYAVRSPERRAYRKEYDARRYRLRREA